MGITLHGIIECWIEGTDFKHEGWEKFATVDFNKDRQLQDFLSEKYGDKRNFLRLGVPVRSYLFKHSFESTRISEQDIGFSAGFLATAECKAAIEAGIKSQTFKATHAFMEQMEMAYEGVRLLYYHS